jgi:predicted MFS family arabinose efflux permease
VGFLIAGGALALSLGVAVVVVRDPPEEPEVARPSLSGLVSDLADPGVLLAGAFLFLWCFNPFSASVQYLHVVEDLGLGEAAYGELVSIQAIGAVVAASTYGLYCRRLPFGALLGLSVVVGVGGTLAWWLADDLVSARAVAVVWGWCVMTGTIVQLDLAARTCPPARAGTIFALLMALSNLAASLAEGVGGPLFERWGHAWGRPAAYDALVLVGAGTTLLSALLVPALRRRAATADRA